MWIGKYWQYQACYMILYFILSCHMEDLNVKTKGWVINAPKETRVQEGLCAYIPCTFTYNSNLGNLTEGSQATWFKGKNFYSDLIVAYRGIPSVSSGKSERFLVTGDLEKGDCSLSINDVVKKDEGTYRFRVEGSRRLKFNYVDIMPLLLVTNLTQEPDIFPLEKIIAGEEVNLTCTAPGRCAGTAPNITWQGIVKKMKYKTHVEKHPDGNHTFFSRVIFTASMKEHNSLLTCNVKYINDISTSKTITLKVESPNSTAINAPNSISTVDNDNIRYELRNPSVESPYQDLKHPTNEVYTNVITEN
ncbi:sialic acid-binding Ig-like lectin 14 isoform X2 [Bombina bombina]|uniref:sialic acid-binding Ig-like lectin 14 isoform X2 n=1 Tax=Bombina bombina TaxID=8345 RepID=UPI00235A9260|nr:sialic acid-binding Ig-like lectin 14 isoform X2 [Bombina bombina]